MDKKRLLRVTGDDIGIEMRYKDFEHGVPHWFSAPRKALLDIKRNGYAIARCTGNFAEFYQEYGRISVRFTWLSHENDGIYGSEDSFDIPEKPFLDFIENPTETELRLLSLPPYAKPYLDFSNAQKVITRLNRNERKQLGRALSRQFNWPRAGEIKFYPDWDPKSFMFDEIDRDGNPGISGGLILHTGSGRSCKYYSIHT